MWIVAGDEECKDGAVGDNGDISGWIVFHDGIDGVIESGVGLVCGFLAKNELVWVGKEGGNGRLKRPDIPKIRHARPVMLLQPRRVMPRYVERVCHDLACFTGFVFCAGDKHGWLVGCDVRKEVKAKGTAVFRQLPCM